MPNLPCSGKNCCCLPSLLPLQSGTSSSQLLPSTTGMCGAALRTGRAATLPSSVETWCAGTKFLKSNTSLHHTPHSVSFELQPSSWETPNCSLNNCCKQPPSHNSQNPTSVPLSTLKMQNSYSRWHLLPINQQGYKHWAFFCLVPSNSRSL